MKPRNTSDIKHEVKENSDDKKELVTTEEKVDIQQDKDKEIDTEEQEQQVNNNKNLQEPASV